MPAPIGHVALNAVFLAPGESGGTETYLQELVPALATEFPATRFTVLTSRRGARALHAGGWSAFAKLVALPVDEGERARRLAVEQVLLPAAARRHGAQLLHSVASVAPVRPAMPAVVTVHDVTFFKLATFRFTTTAALRLIVAAAARRADALVTSSVAARDEICAELGIAPGRFVVAPLGPGRPPRVEPAPDAAVRARYGLTGRRIVLCVGAKRPHKNQELLIRALDHLPEDVAVVLAGHAEPYEARLRALAAASGQSRRVAIPGHVPQADLEALWRAAGCLAFPTLSEGFGLPVLEALSRGVAVACSDLPVLREVGGDAVGYFDPRDAAGAARAIEAALGDGATAGERGRAHARRFSWPATARATFEAYERALAG